MKRQLILIFVSVALLASCQEVGPAVNLGGNVSRTDTTYIDTNPEAPQPRRALIEEFTGVRCVNCPRAHGTILSLQDAFPGRIIPVGIHTGIFSAPYSGRNDFRIPQGSSLENLLGGAQGYPSGAINRTRFASESHIIISDQKWNSYIGDVLQGVPAANVSVQSAINATTNEAEVQVRIRLNTALTGVHHLTLYLTEDNIIDWQLTPAGVDSSYRHKHVLRKCITPYNGAIITAPDFAPNRIFVFNYSFPVESNWVLTNCKVVAFLHRIGEDPVVLQSAEANLN
jgi:hypothetical protein